MTTRSDSGSRPPSSGRGAAGTHRSESLNDFVYRVLKNEILLCRLAPGAEISETLLVERYGFSRAPLRSALTRLRQERLVLTRGRLGHVVAPITVQDVHEVFQLRLLLEAEATRLAAGRVDADRLRGLDARVRARHPARGDRTSEEYREANHAFHRHVVEACGNRRLAELVVSLMEQHERIVHFSLALHNRDSEFHHVHDGLVAALLRGDGELAAALACDAIQGSQNKIIQSFAAAGAPLAASPEGRKAGRVDHGAGGG